jgi:hypothetical protein
LTATKPTPADRCTYPPVTNYRRALDAEPKLRAIERAVDALCALVRPGDTLCAGCAWETIIKPLTIPLLGWDRGYPNEPAAEPDLTAGVRRFRVHSLAELAARDDRRVQAETETEKWLRSSVAYDAVTDEWIARLHNADPGNGHGIGKP